MHNRDQDSMLSNFIPGFLHVENPFTKRALETVNMRAVTDINLALITYYVFIYCSRLHCGLMDLEFCVLYVCMHVD
jgi:hypothetical protein